LRQQWTGGVHGIVPAWNGVNHIGLQLQRIGQLRAGNALLFQALELRTRRCMLDLDRVELLHDRALAGDFIPPPANGQLHDILRPQPPQCRPLPEPTDGLPLADPDRAGVPQHVQPQPVHR
jgi:hypothetical protein